MSHTDTTQETPQWAIDAAELIYRNLTDPPPAPLSVRDCAAIIARHAPICYDPTTEFDKGFTRAHRESQARIAELEAENTHLREVMAEFCLNP